MRAARNLVESVTGRVGERAAKGKCAMTGAFAERGNLSSRCQGSSSGKRGTGTGQPVVGDFDIGVNGVMRSAPSFGPVPTQKRKSPILKLIMGEQKTFLPTVAQL